MPRGVVPVPDREWQWRSFRSKLEDIGFNDVFAAIKAGREIGDSVHLRGGWYKQIPYHPIKKTKGKKRYSKQQLKAIKVYYKLKGII